MIETFQRIDDHTMSHVREFGRQYGCSDEVALKFLLKVGKYQQEAEEDDEAYPDFPSRGIVRTDLTMIHTGQRIRDVDLARREEPEGACAA